MDNRVGHDERMPSLIRPPDMPEDVVGAIETMGNKARSEILRVLLERGPMTRNQISEHLEGASVGKSVPSRMVWNHLQAMEDIGVVSCDLPRDQRHGRVTHWTANYDEAVALADLWLAFLRGERKEGARGAEADSTDHHA